MSDPSLMTTSTLQVKTIDTRGPLAILENPPLAVSVRVDVALRFDCNTRIKVALMRLLLLFVLMTSSLLLSGCITKGDAKLVGN